MDVEILKLARTGNLELLKNLNQTELANAVGQNGQSILHEAISFSKDNIAEYAIANGVKPDAICKRGQTALHYAAIYKNLKVTSLLLLANADVNLADIYGNIPAWYSALSAGNLTSLKIFQLLAKNGADLDHKNLSGRSIIDIYKP